MGGREPEPDPRAGGVAQVALGDGLLEHPGERRLRGLGLAVEAELQLCVAEPKLARLGSRQELAGLEVVGADAELLGERTKRLHRRRPIAELEA